MREIKFRGKIKNKKDLKRFINNNGWVYGYYLKEEGLKITIGKGSKEYEKHYIITNNDKDEFIEVIPETVGQYTGLFDKNNKPIYEGDILENTAVNFKFIVKFIKTKWALQKLEYPEDNLDMYDFFYRIPTMFELVGNIYEKEE